MISLPGLSMRLALGAVVALGVPIAHAQSYPVKPLRLIAPFAAGGGIDLIARLLAGRLGEGLGQPVIVENRPGALTVVGTLAAARSAPDGYTLLLSQDTTMTLSQHLFSKVPYDSVKDFEPVSLVSIYAMLVVVGQKLPVQSFPELIARAKANPGKLSYGTGSPIGMLAGELLKSVTSTDMAHIPYKGTAPAVQDLMAGTIDFVFSDYGAYLPHHGKGKLRALASTGSVRADTVDVPTIRQTGTDYEVTGWNGLYAPGGTPQPIVQRVSAEVVKATANPDYVKRIEAVTLGAASSTPAQLAARQKAETAAWDTLVKSRGLKLLVE